MSIWKDEVVAPALSVALADTLEEAIELATRSDFANGACVYTDSAKPIRQFRDAMDAGMLGGNVSVPAPMAFFFFSRYKKSFFGELHAKGRHFYARKKMVVARY